MEPPIITDLLYLIVDNVPHKTLIQVSKFFNSYKYFKLVEQIKYDNYREMRLCANRYTTIPELIKFDNIQLITILDIDNEYATYIYTKKREFRSMNTLKYVSLRERMGFKIPEIEIGIYEADGADYNTSWMDCAILDRVTKHNKRYCNIGGYKVLRCGN